MLKGLIFGPTGRAMTPTHTRKGGKLYRYYEQARIVQLLVERVDLSEKGADITLRTEGLASLIQDLHAVSGQRKDAA